jgi:hypothetical protein
VESIGYAVMSISNRVDRVVLVVQRTVSVLLRIALVSGRINLVFGTIKYVLLRTVRIHERIDYVVGRCS